MSLQWLLLIYTLPSQPSRKRAYVWRELKKLGAVYLRDGVALLPARRELQERMQAIATRIDEYEGTVDLVVAPSFAGRPDEDFVHRFNEERSSEYAEIYHACVRFLRDVLEEVDADQFGFPDVSNLESELGRLGRWYAQVRERDYFDDPSGARVAEILQKCETAFERFTLEASERVDTGDQNEARGRPEREDVFERLSGTAADVSPDLPL